MTQRKKKDDAETPKGLATATVGGRCTECGANNIIEHPRKAPLLVCEECQTMYRPATVEAEVAPTTKRRMEEIALIFLQLAFSIQMSKANKLDLEGAGVSDDEFFEFIDYVAPGLTAQLEKESGETWNPADHLDEILQGASERMKADDLLKPKRGSTCLECQAGKLEFPVYQGLYDLSGDLSCTNCGATLPRKK